MNPLLWKLAVLISEIRYTERSLGEHLRDLSGEMSEWIQTRDELITRRDELSEQIRTILTDLNDNLRDITVLWERK